MVNIKYVTFDNSILNSYLFECKNPKGVIQIVHGLQEHSKRYFDFCKFLQENNYIVFVSDLRGHGETAINNDFGYSDNDIFEEICKDQLHISEYLKNKYPNLDLYFIGHSFGSFIGQNYILNNKLIKKFVLVGSSFNNTLEHKMGKFVASIKQMFFGKHAKSTLVEFLSIKAYGRKFKDGNWLTIDEKNFIDYKNDKFCGNSFPISFYKSMFSHTPKAYKGLLEKKPKTQILILAGKEDPVGKCGKLVIKLADTYSKAKFPTTLKLYDNLKHEILNDKGKTLIYEDILVFLSNPINEYTFKI